MSGLRSTTELMDHASKKAEQVCIWDVTASGDCSCQYENPESGGSDFACVSWLRYLSLLSARTSCATGIVQPQQCRAEHRITEFTCKT